MTQKEYESLTGRAFLIPKQFVNSNKVELCDHTHFSFIPNGYNGNKISGYVFFVVNQQTYIQDARINYDELLTYEVKPITTNFRWRKA